MAIPSDLVPHLPGPKNGVVSCLSFAPLDTNWRLHCIGLTLLIDKYVDAKVRNKNALVKRSQVIDTTLEYNVLISNQLCFVAPEA